VTKIPKDKLPKCNGESQCKLKIKHPPNGEEFALGCSICRNDAANRRDF
jgi:E3 ubiquitin-protein ligase MYCBP2